MRFIVLAFVIFLISGLPAWACSPAPPREGLTVETLVEEIMKTHPSFIGKVRVTKVEKDEHDVTYKMQVLKQYVGKPVKELTLTGSEADSCMAYHAEGSEILLRLMKDTSEPQYIDMFNSYFAGMDSKEVEAYLDQDKENLEAVPQ